MTAHNTLYPIQGLWIGPRLSLLEQLSIESFLQNGHEYHLYTYEPVENIPKGTTVLNAEEILSKSHIFDNQSGLVSNRKVSFSDLFRYKLLSERGGLYADLDIVCLKPFCFEQELLIATESLAVPWRSKWIETKMSPLVIQPHSWSPFGALYSLMNLNVIKASPGNPFMTELYNVASLMDKNRVIHSELGPQLGAELYQKHRDRLALDVFLAPSDWFNPISFSSLSQFFKKTKNPLQHLGSQVFGVHLYANIWRANMYYRQHKPYGPRTFFSPVMDMDAYYSPDCLYGALQHRYGFTSPQ